MCTHARMHARIHTCTYACLNATMSGLPRKDRERKGKKREGFTDKQQKARKKTT